MLRPRMFRRKTRTFVLVVAISLAILYRLGYIGLLSDGGQVVYSPYVPSEPEPFAPDSPWCRENECTSGNWVPRSPPFSTMQDFLAVYGNKHQPSWDGCRPAPDPAVPWTPEEKKAAGEKRMLETSNWVWKPHKGQMREWDAEAFMVRLLQSPGGLILVGDSISGQHARSLAYLFNQFDVPHDSNVTGLVRHSDRFIHRHTLRKNHPTTARLLKRAGVPASRLDRPVLTWVEDHLLLSKEAMMEITVPLGADPNYFWYHTPAHVDEWESYLEDMTRPQKGEENTVTADTILVLTTGPHWSRGLLSMLPNGDSDELEQDNLLTAYTQMVDRVSERLSFIPSLSIYYRSASPGHPNCKSAKAPYKSANHARKAEANLSARIQQAAREMYPDDPKMGEQQARVRKRWDWDRLNVHDRVWQRKVGKLMQRREAHGNRGDMGMAKWAFMDNWEMDLIRVDAHSEPEDDKDCLHWCFPTVINQWNYHLYHRVVEDDELKAKSPPGSRFGRPPLVRGLTSTKVDY